MKEKTKKILKGAGLTLGAVALLTLGVAVGACSAKAGTKQQTAITTPVAKSLIQRPKKAEELTDLTGTKWLMNAEPEQFYSSSTIGLKGVTSVTGYAFTAIRRVPVSGIGARVTFSNGGQNSSASVFYGTGTTYNGWYSKSSGTSTATFAPIPNPPTITITGGVQVSNFDLINWFQNNATRVYDDSEPLPEIKEKVVLNSSYDFRRWFGNVDPTTGAIQFKLPTGISLYSVRVGGLEWENLGNERIYNCIEFTLQPLNASNSLAVSDNLAKTAESLYGDKYTDFCMLSGVYYSYQEGYDGTYTVIQDSALPSVDYRDRIYSMPMVSAQLDGTANNVNALDIRNCVIPSIYRSFGIIEDDGVIFSTNGYSSVTLRQLLGMDFSSVVNYSEGTASAFSLLTQAFGSVAGLLAVQVLPNITLGLLLFLPLIAAVIVLIIKAVKK